MLHSKLNVDMTKENTFILLKWKKVNWKHGILKVSTSICFEICFSFLNQLLPTIDEFRKKKWLS